MIDPETIEQLQVVKYPRPVLHRPTQPVTKFDDTLKKLAEKMIQLMHESNGVGLAATQVGLPFRIFVANPTGQVGNDLVFINGEIIDTDGWIEHEEGCLSVPQVFGKVRRHTKVTIRAVDLSGKPFELQATDLLARIIQHETDHLDGKLILDRMTKMAKFAHRRQIKYLEGQAEGKE